MRLKYITAILLLIGLVGACQATIFLGIESQIFESTENFDDDLVISGNRVRFESSIEGDLIGASRELVFYGNCDGNIIWASEKVNVGGEVKSSVRAFARTIDINSVIGRNLVAAGQKVIVVPGTKIGKDATIYADEVEFDGYIGNDLKVGCGSITLSGVINGDVDIQTEKLMIMPNVVINGNLTYKTPEDIKIPNSVRIKGETKWQQVEIDGKKSGYRALTPMVISIIMFIVASFLYYLWVMIWLLVFNNTGLIILSLFSLAICGLIILNLSKKTAARAVIVMQEKFFTALGLGILIVLLLPFISLIAFISFLGWPLGFLLLFIFGIFGISGAIYAIQFVGCAIGKILNLGKKPLSSITFLIGVVVVVLLMMVPILNWLIMAIILGAGMGSVILSLDKFKDKKLILDKKPESAE